MDRVTEALDNNQCVISLFLDLSKAFDTVNHSILLNKLYRYGVRGIALDFISSYLQNRSQCVEIDGVTSSSLAVTCGVPQGSTLGPVLFLLYINDLHLCTELLQILLFADDTTLICSSNDLVSLVNTVNSELSHLQTWFNLNKLSLNPSKSCYIIFHNQKIVPTHPDIIIGNQIIKKVQSCKFLGVEIDSTLKWLNHIRFLEKKLSSTIYIIRNIRHKITRITALKLYDTLIVSHLNYCNTVWGNAYKTYLGNLFRLQKRALRLCYGGCGLTSDILFTTTNKLSLFNIHKLCTAQLIFHYFHNISDIPKIIVTLFNKISDIHGFHTRSSDNLSLHTHFGKLHARSTSLKIYAPFFWNSLPINIRQFSSLHLFKKN